MQYNLVLLAGNECVLNMGDNYFMQWPNELLLGDYVCLRYF